MHAWCPLADMTSISRITFRSRAQRLSSCRSLAAQALGPSSRCVFVPRGRRLTMGSIARLAPCTIEPMVGLDSPTYLRPGPLGDTPSCPAIWQPLLAAFSCLRRGCQTMGTASESTTCPIRLGASESLPSHRAHAGAHSGVLRTTSSSLPGELASDSIAIHTPGTVLQE